MTSTLPFTEEEDLASTDVFGVPAAATDHKFMFLVNKHFGNQELHKACRRCSYMREPQQVCHGMQNLLQGLIAALENPGHNCLVDDIRCIQQGSASVGNMQPQESLQLI